MSKNVLVTGGAGFIGSHLCIKLIEQNYKVRIIDDLSNGLQSNLNLLPTSIEFIQESITNFQALQKASLDCEAIFHLAAVSNVQETLDKPDYAHQVNATGTLNILRVAKENNSKIIYSSSAAIYGDTPEHPKTECGKKEPISLYGSQKLLGEHYAKNYADIFGVQTVCLRYFNIYGPRQRPDSPYSGVISQFVNRALARKEITIHGDGLQTRDFVSVHDVVNANLLAFTTKTNPFSTYNISSGVETSIKELAALITDLAKSDAPIIHTEKRAGDIKNSCGNAQKVQKGLNFTAKTDINSGLKELIDWARTQN